MKPTIKFTAVAYDIGGKTGYRPQLEGAEGIFDLDFCKEVVTEKRLAMSADELLHAMEMLAEVAGNKVAEDGRPRGITRLIKWNRFGKGSLESPTSPWNENCRAEIRPQLLADAAKVIDATFVNTADGINVKLSYVSWPGAKTVINVLKVGKTVIAYGNHMEITEGDVVTLVIGTQTYALTCTESDVAHAVFNWPAGCAPESGTQGTFVMKSRGGVAGGEVYTNKKTVTIVEDTTPPAPTVTSVKSEGASEGTCNKGSSFDIVGTNLASAEVKLEWVDSATRTQQTATVADAELTRTGTTKITVSSAGWAVCQGEAYDDQFVVQVVTEGGTAEKTCLQG